MFTGIIVEMAEVVSLRMKGGGATLSLRSKAIAPHAILGDSIAVNGVCLTVTDIKGQNMSFDLSYETLKSTNMGELRPADRVNIEPSLRPDGRLGGHFVTGHVDAVGKIRSKKQAGDAFRVEIDAPASVTDYLVEKGSVTVDGISLTVVDVLKGGFSTVIIPHTAEVTTIGVKTTGDTVNIEADILGKYVAKFLRKGKDSSLMESLIKSGFVSG